MSSKTNVAVFDAAEMLTHAALRGDPAMTARAYAAVDQAARVDATVPDAETRSAVVDANPMVAATLGWIDLPELARRVLPDPARFLDPDEAEAVAADPGALRVAVRARTLGRHFTDVLADSTERRSHYALAARGDAKDVLAVYQELLEQGEFDPTDG